MPYGKFKMGKEKPKKPGDRMDIMPVKPGKPGRGKLKPIVGTKKPNKRGM